jgi:uncharacterized protein YpuA (DUF1002 family)
MPAWVRLGMPPGDVDLVAAPFPAATPAASAGALNGGLIVNSCQGEP